MAKPTPTGEYEALMNAVTQFPEGAGIEQIEATLASRPSRRSLQRWLSDLMGQGRLRREGEGRATRYLSGKVASAVALETAQNNMTAQAEILIPLTLEAKQIEAHVC